ncbi:MAG: diguanylate cyclase [Solirubrobacteraceae bacterium]|nr:diguanylate cyclase [Solirubrobacteraceae bacterium]
MYTAAGLLMLSLLVVGVDDSFDVPVIDWLAGSAIGLGLIFIVAAAKLPVSGMPAGLLLATAIISAAVVASGEADTPFALLYIWIAIEGWYFLGPRGAGVVTAVNVLASAAAMAIVARPEDNAITWWLMVAGTTVTVAVLAAVLRLRADGLVATLAEAASRDALTGVLNRAGFQGHADREMARACRHDLPLAIVLADLDHFKAVNDTFGHRGGDGALAAFADLCRAHTRPDDRIARVGGEEFVLLLPHTDRAGAVAIAERLRHAMHAHLTSPDGTPITASFGVAAHPDDGSNVEMLLGEADRALYAAKSLGRDRTIATGAGDRSPLASAL